MATKTYELADKSVGFYDPDTCEKVVGDGRLEVDLKKRVGKTTLATIKAGGLIEVNDKPSKAETAKGADKDKAADGAAK
jgi:hypothetical protein